MVITIYFHDNYAISLYKNVYFYVLAANPPPIRAVLLFFSRSRQIFWKRVLTNRLALAIINKLDSYERDQAK